MAPPLSAAAFANIGKYTGCTGLIPLGQTCQDYASLLRSQHPWCALAEQRWRPKEQNQCYVSNEDYRGMLLHGNGWFPRLKNGQTSKPHFEFRQWAQGPSNRNVLDMRLTDDYIFVCTAAWGSESITDNQSTRIRAHPDSLRPHSDEYQPKLLQEISLHSSPRRCVQSPSVTVSRGNSTANRSGPHSRIFIWDAPSLDLVQEVLVPTQCLNCIDFHPASESPSYAVLGDSEVTLHILAKSDWENSFSCASYPLVSSGGGEINDVRVTRNSIAFAIRTILRFPISLELIDLHNPSLLKPTAEARSDHFRKFNHWIHSVELPNASSAPYTAAAVGESVINGVFGLLLLDMRVSHPEVGIISLERQMLWPLRVTQGGNTIIANVSRPGWAVVDSAEVLQADPRRIGGAASTDQSAVVRVHRFPGLRIEDCRTMHDHLYVYGVASSGTHSAVHRRPLLSNLVLPPTEELFQLPLVAQNSMDDSKSLKLLQCHERQLLVTEGATMTVAKPLKHPNLDTDE